MADSYATAVAIPGGQHPKIVSNEEYQNLGLEISSLPYDAKCAKVQEFLRRHANCQINLTYLFDAIKFSSMGTLSRWLQAIRSSAEGQPLVPASAAQGMASNNFRQAIDGSRMLGHARRPCEFATGGGPVHFAGGSPWTVPAQSAAIYFQNAPFPSTLTNQVS